MKYSLKASGSGRIQEALVHLCRQGGLGEPLVLHGVTQIAVARFAAALAIACVKAGGDAEELASIFMQASVNNASALQKALADCSLVLETLEDYRAAKAVIHKDKSGVEVVPSDFTVDSFWKGGAPSAPRPSAGLIGKLGL